MPNAGEKGYSITETTVIGPEGYQEGYEVRAFGLNVKDRPSSLKINTLQGSAQGSKGESYSAFMASTNEEGESFFDVLGHELTPRELVITLMQHYSATPSKTVLYSALETNPSYSNIFHEGQKIRGIVMGNHLTSRLLQINRNLTENGDTNKRVALLSNEEDSVCDSIQRAISKNCSWRMTSWRVLEEEDAKRVYNWLKGMLDKSTGKSTTVPEDLLAD